MSYKLYITTQIEEKEGDKRSDQWRMQKGFWCRLGSHARQTEGDFKWNREKNPWEEKVTLVMRVWLGICFSSQFNHMHDLLRTKEYHKDLNSKSKLNRNRGDLSVISIQLPQLEEGKSQENFPHLYSIPFWTSSVFTFLSSCHERAWRKERHL